MTFPSGGSVFDEELQCVKHYFEKWSHCERAIAVCSMLKQFQYPTLRFIHSKIEATYAQSNDCDKNKRMEQQSNDKSYIYELCDSYKSLTNINSDVQLNNNNKDSIYYESDRLIIGDNNSTTTTTATTTTATNNNNNLINSNTINNNNNNNNYSNNNANSNTSIKVNLVADKFSTKEEILKEILNCILMLKIGNDDVIQEYLALIPFMVNDTERRIINVQVVMQTLSILVAHPALSSDDLRTVKEHIERLKKIISEQNGQLQNADWQAVVRPMYSSYYKNTANNNIFSSLSSVGSSQIHNENIYDTQSDYIETDSGSAGRSSGGGSDFIPYLNLSNKPYPSDDIFLINASDDQNNSFSKNGTEIPDYLDYHESNSSDQPMHHQKLQNACQFATNLAHKPNPLIDSISKTRRSNSLTTGGLKHNDAFLGLSGFTLSMENLLHLHKQRSCSLSIDNPTRLLMTASSGSETRLDDLMKPTYQAFQTQNVGMTYVQPWFKRLRLHKYYSHFENFTYEQMMDVTDEFLQQLGITQGARTKLVNSIHKLKEHSTRLNETEQKLKSGEISLDTAIKLLLEIVETPIKPIESYDSNDVTFQFLNLLNVVCEIMISKKNQIGQQDEESVKQLIHVFEIAMKVNVEPFLQHANQLKTLRYDIDVIGMKFPAKNQYHKSGGGSANGSSSKPRWPSATKLHNKNGSETKPHRKNSNPMSNFNFVSMQQMQKQAKSAPHLGSKSKPTQQRSSRQSEFNNNYHATPTSSYSKSSSYPNFGSNGSSAASSNGGGGQQYANVGNQTATPQLHHSYHRHSVSNLITITPAKTTVTITPTVPITQHQKTSSCVGLHLSSQSTPHTGLNSNTSSNSAPSAPITSSSLVPTMHYCSHQCSTELTPVSTIGRSSSTGGGSYLKQAANKHSLGDISPYRDLEFLSLQMTEQAIN